MKKIALTLSILLIAGSIIALKAIPTQKTANTVATQNVSSNTKINKLNEKLNKILSEDEVVKIKYKINKLLNQLKNKMLKLKNEMKDMSPKSNGGPATTVKNSPSTTNSAKAGIPAK